MFFIEGRLYIVLSKIVLMIEWRLCVFVLWFIVFLVIVLSVLLWNFSFIFFIENNVLYCLVIVFLGLCRIWISVFLFNFLRFVIIGRCLMNFGIRLYFIKFLGLICLNSLLICLLFFFDLIVVLNLIFVFFCVCCLIILLRLVNVLL